MFNKHQKINHELAIENARGCFFMFRHGDPDDHHKVGNSGVRIIVQEFGNYQPFVLTSKTKGWLKKVYKITEKQADEVYKLLLAKAKKTIRETEKKNNFRQDPGYIPGTRLKWTTGSHGQQTLFGVNV